MDRVEVTMKFARGKMIPLTFVRSNADYRIKKVLIQFERFDGGKKYICFGVECEQIVGELRMNVSDFSFWFHGQDYIAS